MAKSCSLLPMLIGAGAFPLVAHALDTVELHAPDNPPLLVSEASALQAPPGDLVLPIGQGLLDNAFGPRKLQPVLQRPSAPRPEDAGGFAASEVTSVLEEIRLAPPPPRAPAPGFAAQFAAALAIVGLVAKRRLGGR